MKKHPDIILDELIVERYESKGGGHTAFLEQGVLEPDPNNPVKGFVAFSIDRFLDEESILLIEDVYKKGYRLGYKDGYSTGVSNSKYH